MIRPGPAGQGRARRAPDGAAGPALPREPGGVWRGVCRHEARGSARRRPVGPPTLTGLAMPRAAVRDRDHAGVTGALRGVSRCCPPPPPRP